MKYDIEALKRKMLVKYPFFGSIVANIEYKEKYDINTAGTDGEKICYNPKFLESLSIDEQIFTFAHEVCHIAFNHILRSEGKDHYTWNVATDAVINQFLIRDGLKMPYGCVDIPNAIYYDAEQLYEKMLKEKQLNQQNEQGNGENQQSNQQQNGQGQSDQKSGSPVASQGTSSNNTERNVDDSSPNQEDNQKDSQNGNQQDSGNDKNKNVGHDDHSMWADAVKKNKEKAKSEKKDSQDKKNGNSDKKEDASVSNQEKSEVEKKQKELEKMGEKNAFDKNREEKRKALEKLKEEITKKASQAGTTSNGDLRQVNDIGHSRPLIDWRYVLRETIKYDVDWSYKNATIEEGVVLPNLEEIPFPETEILLDTSGSVNENLLKNFLRECKNILKYSKLKVGCFDTKFYGFKEIRTENDLENMNLQGGGGTDFDVAVNAFSNRVENKIVFTDGEASMPKKSVNAVWLVYGNNNICPPGGKVIYITKKYLEQSYSFIVKSKTLSKKY